LCLAGCAPSAARIRKDLGAGRAQGILIDKVPFEPQRPGHCGPAALSSLLGFWGRLATQEEIGKEIYSAELKGTLGFFLWRYARRAALVALEMPESSLETLDGLVTQGLPVILDLGLGSKGPQHYILVVGHDRSRDLWILQDGRRPDRVVTQDWLLARWAPTRRWALLAFPADHWVEMPGADLHLQAAERVEELGHPEAALRHLEAARAERGADAVILFRTGRLQKVLDRTDAAEKSYREAMRLAPASPDAFNNLALMLSEHPARLDEAEALGRTAVSLARKGGDAALRVPYALDTLGQVLRKQGRAKEARQAFEAALKAAEPGSPLAQEIQGHLGTR
jgi:tetratricopeptide (TPR) repeat protein